MAQVWFSGQSDHVIDKINPRFLVRNWPPAFTEWSTKAVRDAFFASPLFPRLLNSDALKKAIACGVENGTLAYVGKTSNGIYEPFHYQTSLNDREVEISEDMFIITTETAQAYQAALAVAENPSTPTQEANTDTPVNTTSLTKTVAEAPIPYVSNNTNLSKDEAETIAAAPVVLPRLLKWSGEVPNGKYMSFYTKAISKFAADPNLKLTLKVEFLVEGELTPEKIQETQVALAELGLNDHIAILNDS